MPTSPYISQKVKSEQNLYEDLVIESLKFYGQDVYYIPREIVNKDPIFLDDVPSRFSDAYKIEMYVENTEGFDGEGDLFTKFGIELRDQATFVVARRRWKHLIGNYLDEKKFRPREGDVIYLPMSNSIFQIMKVETETPFYQLSQLPTFRLQAELFEYSDEDFDTGIDAIDDVEYEGAFQYKVTMRPRDATGSLAAAVATINEQGTITGLTLTNAGRGYTTPPTISYSDFDSGEFQKFGLNSINMNRAQGLEDSFLFTGANGVAEMFVLISTYPTNQASLFLHGGDSGQTMWGITSGGGLAYQNVNGSVTGIPSATFTRGLWHHIAIAQDSDNLSVYFDGTKVLDSASPATANFATEEGFSVGATAARQFNGTNWEAGNGYIDEIRFRVGARNTLIGDSDMTVPTGQYDSDSSTILLEHADGTTPDITPTIDATTGSVTGFTINSGGFLYQEAPTLTFSAPDSGGDFVVGEVITQVNTKYTMRGEVTDWSDSDRVLQIAHAGATNGEFHEFGVNRKISGANASWVPSLVEELQNIQVTNQNQTFNDFEGDFLDFSESNPFGDME